MITRADLDELVARRAEKAGARVLEGHEAVAPLVDRGLVRGAVVLNKDTGEVDEITARYVVVADGANSRFGRALGTSRDRAYPARHGHPRATSRAPATTSRGSRATSTSGTRPATSCPATGGSSRSATAG